MTRKIFRSILLTSLCVLAISLSISTGCLYYYFEDIQTQQLRSELFLAASAVEENGAGYLQNLVTDDLRLTLIKADGTVLYDTSVDAMTMENHADREEILEALKTGEGKSAHYSSTLTEKTLYHAVLLTNGTVLRISASQATVLTLLVNAIPWLVAAAVLAAIFSWFLAKQLSKRIIMPLNQVDLENPLENDVYEELSPLLSHIHHQRHLLDAQLLQLRQKTDEFEHITANMKEGLVLLDAKGKILSINPAAAALFGAENDPTGLDFLSVERSHEINRATALALDNGHTKLRKELNGRCYQFDISRIESTGKTLGLVILLFDVSEQESAERTRREFTANVSHEMKTPLTSIIASADLIENQLVKPEDLPRFISHIRKEASRLRTLIEDTIQLSQLDEGAAMPSEQIDLSVVADQVVDQLRNTADQKQVKIELTAERCILNGAPQLLHEIVYNLTENAVMYNVAGGTVNVSVQKISGGSKLTVSDTGIGIPAEHQERIFERFYRVDKSHSKTSGGTGLGLSIVKHAASYFNAEINLQSEPGRGTTITVTFPE